MPFMFRVIAKAFDFIVGGASTRHVDLLPTEDEAEIRRKDTLRRTRNFDHDYTAAVRRLRDRLDRKFPDGQYAHRRMRLSVTQDHAEDRAQAVDTMSAVIAMALRNGATVDEAAEAGAASVGI
ncbi:hypothetical protein LOK46_25615 [Methylobacterium sp. NMS14P]|uniref:hypothetical protein n=1 Tax=Methylobacterium sp. NMS14P TaxID=2894310 RepID=UPI0023587E08|nr:hypothetical protein [Methylobacterium sp. NMS14P]WCS24473.1 hypothetical protein LOK46_25615 [Methylobacterium sp. NMS14P]